MSEPLFFAEASANISGLVSDVVKAGAATLTDEELARRCHLHISIFHEKSPEYTVIVAATLLTREIQRAVRESKLSQN